MRVELYGCVQGTTSSLLPENHLKALNMHLLDMPTYRFVNEKTGRRNYIISNSLRGREKLEEAINVNKTLYYSS